MQSRNSGTYGYDGAEPSAPQPFAAPASRLVQYAGAATSIALILGVVVWGYRLAVRDVTGVPVIRALEGPARIAPEDPGGDLARHVGLSVNAVAGTGLAAPAPEQVLLAPEPTGLTDADQPMTKLAPLPNPRRTIAAPVVAAAPALPVADVPAGAKALALQPEALPDTDAALAEADGTVVMPPDAVVEDAAAAAQPAGVIPATVPGVTRSPRPLPRPALDLVAESAAAEVAAALGGAAPETIDLDPASLPEGTRLVQLGAFDSPEIAQKEWDRVATRFEALMVGKKRVVQAAASGGRTFYRLRVQGFENVDEARRFCAALVAEQTNCIPALVR
ncbi:MAG: SPOR domain-containing protein [Paracoccaceae bacterium]|nr:SPOR domain-containing protein [Paracoccaceae bacterium]